MQRIDLLCAVLAPMVLGFVLQLTSLSIGLLVVGAWIVVTYVPQLGLLMLIYNRHRALLEKVAHSNDDAASKSKLLDKQAPASSTSQLPFATLINGWHTYISQEAFLASLAFALLYLTILAPGGLTTAYLKSRVCQVAHECQPRCCWI
jgi:solute carrier family 40 (iron-regulated transporter), member 1